MLPSLPPEGRDRRELGVLLELASVLHNAAGAGDTRFRSVAERAVDLARVLEDEPSLFAALTIASAHHSAVPERSRAEPLLREQVTLAEAWGEQRLEALSALGTNAVLWGARVEARRLLERCRELHDPTSATNHYDPGLAALVYLAIVLRELGRHGRGPRGPARGGGARQAGATVQPLPHRRAAGHDGAAAR